MWKQKNKYERSVNLNLEQHNISCSEPISIFVGPHLMCPRPIKEQEFRMKSNNIQLMVFEEPNIKIYWFV